MKPRRQSRHAAHTVGARCGLFAALALLAAGCSAQPLSEGRAGLPAPQLARASLVVAQTRAQFPELSGARIPFRTLPPPGEGEAAPPEPVLRGSGTGMEPGLQTRERERIEVTLYLDTRGYARGYLEVTRPAGQTDAAAGAPAGTQPGTPAGTPSGPAPGAQPERWPIVAFDLRGDPREEFQFTYALLSPQERLHYLVLIGGRYEADGARYAGYEGTLIEPGPDGDPEPWRRAFKLDFGFRHPLVPPHQPKVEEVVTRFGEFGRAVAQLDRLSQREAAIEGELATLNAATPTPEQATRHAEALRAAQERQAAQRAERAALLDAAQATLLRYYELRRTLSDDYAAFVTSNRYLWLDRAGKQAVYDGWKGVESHHPRIDERVGAFLAHGGDRETVVNARQAAMDTILRNDNWSKDPSKAGAQP